LHQELVWKQDKFLKEEKPLALGHEPLATHKLFTMSSWLFDVERLASGYKPILSFVG
jgi:hypothetical protein